MQVTPNDPNAEAPTQDDGAFVSNNHPLGEGQDQLVLALDLRRFDPDNPDGSPTPDLAFMLAGQSPEKAQALSFLVDSIAELLGFDPSLSRVGFTKVVDFEPGTGSATLDEFRAVVDQLSSDSPTEEIVTEQPIEPIALGPGTTEEEAVAETEPEEPASEPVPEVLEDIPHEQEPEDIVENGAIEPPTTEDSPVGDSIAADPGPVDPPTEG